MTEFEKLTRKLQEAKTAKVVARDRLVKLIDDALEGKIPAPSRYNGALDPLIGILVGLHDDEKSIQEEVFAAMAVKDELTFTDEVSLPLASDERKEIGRAIAHDIELVGSLTEIWPYAIEEMRKEQGFL